MPKCPKCQKEVYFGKYTANTLIETLDIKRIRSVIKYIVLLRMSETLCAPRGEANQDLISLCMPYKVL